MNRPSDKDRFIKDNWKKLSDRELAKETGLTVNAVEKRRRKMGIFRQPANQHTGVEMKKLSSPQALNERVAHELATRKLKRVHSETEKKYKTLQGKLDKVERENEALMQLNRPAHSYTIHKAKKHSGGEATCIVMASDWHVEEHVTKGAVNNLGEVIDWRPILF